ncbi:hypothetical protein QYE76_060159 [Lolium multiflorum]|uniref:No apical meristem-associated C-terminal domain-containing protein n=1 Tax=Lolium multiflorum TaxID=4521 RepID=A0AAD8RZ95_LOLMU|nr:hypothetical protein QYE76_060159 [Lolium multiflorum]
MQQLLVSNPQLVKLASETPTTNLDRMTNWMDKAQSGVQVANKRNNRLHHRQSDDADPGIHPPTARIHLKPSPFSSSSFSSTTMPPKPRKSRAKKERPPGVSKAEWAADELRRQVETSGRAEREKKLNVKRAAMAAEDEQARKVSMAMSMGHARGGGAAMFPGQWPNQGTISSPSAFSPSSFSPSSPAMFQEATYGQPSRFTPSPPDLAGGNLNEGFSPALRRGPLPFGATAAPNDEVMNEMIDSGSAAAAVSPGFFTQEEARATAAVAERNRWVDDVADGSQPVEEEEEEEPTQVLVADGNPPKGKKKRKKDVPPAEPRIKWTPREEECLAEAWMTVSMDGITGANQSSDTYWLRVKAAFDERKLVDPYFNRTIMNRGDKAMATHWGIIHTACSKWHDIQEELRKTPVSGEDFEAKMRRAFDMYSDDAGLTFKFLNVYCRIEKCEKWTEIRTNLSKSKTEQYNPDAPPPGSSDGRPELGQKKAQRSQKDGPTRREDAGGVRQVLGRREVARRREGRQVRRQVEGDARQPRRPDRPAEDDGRGEEEEHRLGVPDGRWQHGTDGRGDEELVRETSQRHPPTRSGQFFVVSGAYLVVLTAYDVDCRCFNVDCGRGVGRRFDHGV